jgi:hypothetical protein
MIPPQDVSIMQRTYLVLVAFMQLSMGVFPYDANAQSLNLQTQMNQMAPAPQTPNFNLRSSQSNTPRAALAPHKIHRKLHKSQ